MSSFTNKQNTSLLWDVLLDELNINKNDSQKVSNIRKVFDKSVQIFSKKINTNVSLIDNNKYFLKQMIVAINKLFPQENIKRININEEIIEQPYRIEDIHSARQFNFENQYDQKKHEFESYMNVEKPKEINLSDNINEGKITAMDALLAEKMNERDLDVRIHSDPNAEKWLQSRETSVKNNEYITKNNTNNINSTNNNFVSSGSKLKYLNIDNNNQNITLNIIDKDKEKKKVSWDNNIESNTEFNTNIFSKLKTIKTATNDIEVTSIPNKYEEQKSMKLPEVKQETIILPNETNTNINNSILNEPILPKNEIIKQLNDMNIKIDKLYELLNKLTSLVQPNNIETCDI